ncbi:MFS transporter [Desulforamulus ruminis]|uniref:MFS transporter n=1 Tax=Desulforamulus ruminis TaxID=1564 RepID=UPI002356D193|nr:MFS transporter [Desulforamulus ruminis]
MSQEVIVRGKQDIINFLNNAGPAKNASIVIFTALGGIFIDAYDFTSLGIGAVQLKEQFGLSAVQMGNLTASMAFGALLGAIFGGYFVDKLGRQKMFYADLWFFVVSALVAAFAPNVEVLMVCRFLMGIGVGLDFPVALSYIAEFSSMKGKGKWVNLWQGMWYVAASFSFLIVLPFYFLGAGPHLWRWAVGFGAVPAIVVLIMRKYFMEESPLWALNHVGIKEAARIIERTYEVKVVLDCKPEDLEPVKEEHKPNLSYGALFTKRYRLRTLMATIVAMTQSMEYFAVGFYLPVIAAMIFGKEFLWAILGSIVFNCFGIVGGTWQAYITDKFGSRKMCIIGYSIACSCLLIIGLFEQHMSVLMQALMIGLFIFGHSFGPGAQGMAVATLSFPASIRGLGSGWGQTMVRVGSITGFYFFPLVLAAVGLQKTLLFLALVPAVGLLSILAIKWDHTGQDVESEALQDELAAKNQGLSAGVNV